MILNQTHLTMQKKFQIVEKNLTRKNGFTLLFTNS